MKEKIKIGVVGLGGRGYGLLRFVMLTMDDVEVVAVCDLYEDRTERGAKAVEEFRGNVPFKTQNYKDILAMPEVDAVVCTTSWRDHFRIVIDTMKAGKYAASEVGGAYSLEECWELVRTYEETGIPCMMMENCCFGRDEMMVLNMVKKGIFGEVVHCSGGYRHDLREEVTHGKEDRHYRLENYLSRNCENYPTHELGPIARVLDINHGNRMLSLVAMASKSAGLQEFIRKDREPDHPLQHAQFAQGDIVTTMIKCARGETITLVLDTSLPRPYSRAFHVQGTKAMFEEDNMSIFIDDTPEAKDHFSWKKHWGNVEKFYEEYDHPVWSEFMKIELGQSLGHGGMDWIEFRAFFDAVKNGTQTPVDVYDMATWAAVSVLSEQSIANGSTPVFFPDFTDGKWITNGPEMEWEFKRENANLNEGVMKKLEAMMAAHEAAAMGTAEN